MEKVKALSLNEVKFGIQLGHAGRKASTQDLGKEDLI